MIQAELAMIFPLLAAGGLALIIPGALAPSERRSGLVLLLGLMMLVALLCLLSTVTLDALTLTYATLALLAGAIAIAPLMDRARAPGLLMVGSLAALALPYALSHLQANAALPMMLLAASTIGLAGSQVLAHHRTRMDGFGQLRLQQPQSGLVFIGWVMLAALFALLAPAAPVGMLIAALVAGLATLITSKTDDALQKTGEAMAAAVLFTSLTPLTLSAAALLGVLAAFTVSRSEALALRMRVDDPHHLLGSIALPALGALLLPAAADASLLATQASAAGTALMLGLIFAAFVWPCVMLLVGLARPGIPASIGVRAE